MPLLDHFRPPLHRRHGWDSFHSGWATRIADDLNENWLPEGFLAEECTLGGQRREIDIATYDVGELAPPSSRNGDGGAATQSRPFTALNPTHVAVLEFPEQTEVRIISQEPTRTLVAAIEIISPANKDRPSSRAQFAAKCVGLLSAGVAVVIVDIVSSRRANLHNVIAKMLRLPSECSMPAETATYTTSYRPLERLNPNPFLRGAQELQMWFGDVQIGRPLPTMPLRLTDDAFVPVDFESTYTEACRKRRIG